MALQNIAKFYVGLGQDNEIEIACSNARKTYSHVAVETNYVGFYEVVQRFGRPELAARYKGAGRVVAVELGELSLAGQLYHTRHRIAKERHQIKYCNQRIAYFQSDEAKLPAWATAESLESNIGLYTRKIADHEALIEQLEEKEARLMAKIAVTKSPDITLDDQGSLVGFTFITKASRRWVAAAVSNEGWQWMGNTLWVDHRSAPALAEGAQEAGLRVGR
jgi:hypothetical protein